MAKGSDNKEAAVDQRRRFLRDSVRRSVPLFVGWVAGSARSLARLAQPKREPPKTSPPPEAQEAAPAQTKDLLDAHYQDFARDNSDSNRSSS